MPVTIEATPGHASANSFIALDAAETYMASRLNATLWDAASTDTKNRALVEATRELSLLKYVGSRTTTTQALSWPRQYARNPDLPALVSVQDLSQLYFDDDIVPQRVKDATCELALEFVKAGTTDVASRDPNANIQQKTIDVISTTFFASEKQPKGLNRFPSVMRFVAELLDEESSGGIQMIRT